MRYVEPTTDRQSSNTLLELRARYRGSNQQQGWHSFVNYGLRLVFGYLGAFNYRIPIPKAIQYRR